MDLGNVNSQKAVGYEAIRELKVPLKQAIEATKKDGLDEIFFKADGKDYVAYGKGLDLKGIPATFNNFPITITHIDNESNSAGEGAKSALKSVGGIVVMSAGGLVGAGIGLYGNAIGGAMGGSAASLGSQAAFIGGSVVVIAGIAAGVTAGAGAIYGAVKGADYNPVNQICK